MPYRSSNELRSLIILAILGRLALGGNASAAAAHHPGGGRHQVGLVVHVHLLDVPVGGEDQVHAMLSGQGLPLVQAMLHLRGIKNASSRGSHRNRHDSFSIYWMFQNSLSFLFFYKRPLPWPRSVAEMPLFR